MCFTKVKEGEARFWPRMTRSEIHNRRTYSVDNITANFSLTIMRERHTGHDTLSIFALMLIGYIAPQLVQGTLFIFALATVASLRKKYCPSSLKGFTHYIGILVRGV